MIFHTFKFLTFLVAKQGRETEAAVFSELHSKLQSLVNKRFCFLQIKSFLSTSFKVIICFFLFKIFMAFIKFQ